MSDALSWMAAVAAEATEPEPESSATEVEPDFPAPAGSTVTEAAPTGPAVLPATTVPAPPEPGTAEPVGPPRTDPAVEPAAAEEPAPATIPVTLPLPPPIEELPVVNPFAAPSPAPAPTDPPADPPTTTAPDSEAFDPFSDPSPAVGPTPSVAETFDPFGGDDLWPTEPEAAESTPPPAAAPAAAGPAPEKSAATIEAVEAPEATGTGAVDSWDDPSTLTHAYLRSLQRATGLSRTAVVEHALKSLATALRLTCGAVRWPLSPGGRRAGAGRRGPARGSLPPGRRARTWPT